MRISDWSADVCSSDLAPGDDELAVDRVAEIARIEPTVGRKRGIGGLLVPKISRHQARPADQDTPDLTIAEIVAAVAANAEFVPRHDTSADDECPAILASFGHARHRSTRRPHPPPTPP